MSSASLNTLHQHSTNLVNDLADLRDGLGHHSPCPFIFIVHSLGGLVVKDALNKSFQIDSKTDRRRAEIAGLTSGVVFLGTPHRGSRVASLGRIAFRMSEVFAAQRPNTRLLRALEANSETLERITQSFHQTLNKTQSLRIFSFHEEKEVRRLGLFSTVVVLPDSALIGHTREECGSIPEDHRYMAKFRRANDVGFTRVCSAIRRCIWPPGLKPDISNDETYQSCLDSLNDPNSRVRIEQVSEQYRESFEWLFDSSRVSFKEWLMDNGEDLGPLFWCTGKPGSGKSTMMKFAMNDLRTQQLLASSANGSSWNTIGFFFHDRGSTAQKTLPGMLKEILFQLLLDLPDLFACVSKEYKSLLRSSREKPVQWPITKLKNVFSNIANLEMNHSTTIRNVCPFIDALDEHAGDNEDLLAVLKSLSRLDDRDVKRKYAINFKLCVASRPWPIFKKELADCPSLAINDHTQGDIERYTLGRLSNASSRSYTAEEDMAPATLATAELRELAESVTSKAAGVFIWVRIVVDELCSGIQNGTPLFALRNILQDMPKELNDLYRRTMEKVKDVKESYVMLQIALHTLEPLPLQLFMGCVNTIVYRKTDCSNSDTVSMLSRLADRTGGLLEGVLRISNQDVVDPSSDHDQSVKEAPQPTFCYHHIVQFIHQTTREFVREEKPSHNFANAKIDETFLSHPGSLMLLNCCCLMVDQPNFGPIQVITRYSLEYAWSVDKLIDSGESRLLKPFHYSIMRLFDKRDTLLKDLLVKTGSINQSLDISGHNYESFRIVMNIHNHILRARF